MAAPGSYLTGRGVVQPLDGLTLRTYLAVVHVTVAAPDGLVPDESFAAGLLTAGVTDPGEDVQIISLTEVSQ